jgi:hypothetical protein
MEYNIFSAALEEEFIRGKESDVPRSIPSKAA